MDAERGRKDPDQGSQIGCNVNQSIDIRADLLISLKDVEVSITADGNEIWIRSGMRDLFRLLNFIPSGILAIRPLHRMLQQMGLTLKYRGKVISFSLLGFKANRLVISLLSFWL